MIGVVAREEDREVARELFELFKTPWEFYDSAGTYEVILAPAGQVPPGKTSIRIVFGSEIVPGEDDGLEADRKDGLTLSLDQGKLPIQGACLLFKNSRAIVNLKSPSGTTARIGYDLYEEIRTLLGKGQSESHARIPTLDLQITVLRDLIVKAGVALTEIPPQPAGHPFSVCLTHDIDHPVLRNHRFDHTAFGFLYRATFGSFLEALRGRISAVELFRNWSAALRYPFVQLGIASDPWACFDRYMDLEKGLASTFFVIPRRGYPGKKLKSANLARRAASYSLKDIEPQLKRIREDGGEIALHGLDAWNDAAAGREERELLRGSPAADATGVRMHWLCFDESSPEHLDQAGFRYDSTVGYNSTVGYRAGTLQVFQPLGTTRLMELPLHIMDTALFYPSHLGLSRMEAAKVVRRFFSDAVRFGGVLTFNWHDRSIAPERQWGDFYREMLEELKPFHPWFATASEATEWFRLRRSAVFEEIRRDGIVVKVRVKIPSRPDSTRLPGLRLRVTGENASHLPVAEKEFQNSCEMSLVA